MRLAQRLLAVLISLVVLTSAFGRASVSWACEGRVCSSDAAMCCCASPGDVRDGSCLASSRESGGVCKGRCACKAVVKAASATTLQVPKSVQSVVLVDVALANPPKPLRLPQTYVLLETPQVRVIPPPDGLPESPCVEHASLRAPPATA